jgi:NAD(P)-dependent dehydrogenase (short-subunit alcohol dehydrogenase family)
VYNNTSNRNANEGSGMSDAMHRYAYSKLALTTWMMEFRRRHPEFKVVSVCPGPVATELARGIFIVSNLMTLLMNLVFPSCDEVV